jgi:hypothetical protein
MERLSAKPSWYVQPVTEVIPGRAPQDSAEHPGYPARSILKPPFGRAHNATTPHGDGEVTISPGAWAAYQADLKGDTVVVTRLRPEDEARGQYWDVQEMKLD